MRVKVCGIKKLEDALMAVKFGADAIGLLVGQKHSATDFISEGLARLIVEKLPPFCSSVFVTHLQDNDKIISLVKFVGTTTIQLHGDSTPEDVSYIKQHLPGIKVIKSLHVVDEYSIEKGFGFLNDVDAILLDTINIETDQVGGTGITHDWSLSRKIVSDYHPVPVILAGGLKPSNVQQAKIGRAHV